MNKTDKTFLTNLIKLFLKTKKRYPTIESLIKENENNPAEPILKIISNSKELTEEYNSIVKELFVSNISAKSSVKMKELLKEKYIFETDLFNKFFDLNLNRSNVGSEEFDKVGLKIQSIISDVVETLVMRMEGGKKFGKYSSSLSDTFYNYVKTFYPYYDHIGVKVSYRK